MAINGVKIIDSDLAHDVYSTFMAGYDTGLPLNEIQTSIELLQAGNDDVDDELFITAYALALWEVGALTEVIRQRVIQAIEDGAFVRYLTENEHDLIAGRTRQQVLARFLTKISQPNTKIRLRNPSIPKPPKQFLFQEGDVLAFHLPDGFYRATILLQRINFRGQWYYRFARPTYQHATKPTLTDIRNGEVMGRTFAPPDFPEYRIGFDMVDVKAKHLRHFAGEFKLIGHLNLSPAAQHCGNQCEAVDFNGFAARFLDFKDILDRKKTAQTYPRQVFSAQKLF